MGWRIREFEVCWLRCSQFGDADQVVGDQIKHEVGGNATDAAVFGLAHGPVLLTPTKDALDHRAARLRHAITLVPRGALVEIEAILVKG